jgi:hypothetical protein
MMKLDRSLRAGSGWTAVFVGDATAAVCLVARIAAASGCTSGSRSDRVATLYRTGWSWQASREP